MRLAARLRPDPLGELLSSPRPPSRKTGPTSKGRGGGRGREGKGREGFCRTNKNTAATALLSHGLPFNVSTPVIHVITWITIYLPTPGGWKAELAWLVDP